MRGYRRKKSRHVLSSPEVSNSSSREKVNSLWKVLVLLTSWWGFSSFAFYVLNNNWSIWESIFFTTQSGLCIGFNLYEDNDTSLSKMFTMVHVCVSSILVACVVSSMKTAISRLESRLVVSVPSLRTLIYTSQIHRCNGLVILCIIISIGTMWAFLFNGFSLLDSFYFALTSASGTGLKTPHVESTTNLLFVSIIKKKIIL